MSGHKKSRVVRADKDRAAKRADKEIKRKLWRLNNPVTRTLIKRQAHKPVEHALSEGSTQEQVGRLSELAQHYDPVKIKLKKTIMDKAPREMDKAIRKFRAEGKEVTVDSLCSEVRSDAGFRSLCGTIGLELAWFEELAQERMEASR